MMDRLFVMGAHSRVGRLLATVMTDMPITRQAREGADAAWTLADGPEPLARAMTGHGAVLCLAGATPGATDFSLNVDIALAAVEAAAAAAVPRVMLASSMAVYGGGDRPHPEDGPCDPAGAYGASKLEMERAAAALGARHGVAVTALRLGNVVGADMLFRNIAAGRDIRIDRFADGTTPRRSYIDPVTLAGILAALVRLKELPPVLNVAADPAVQMGALADAAGVNWTPRPAPDDAIPLAAMDLTRLGRLMPLPCRDAGELVAGLRRAEAGK